MKWTEIPAGDLNAAERRIRVALGDNAGTVVARANADPGFVTNAAGFTVNGGHEPTMSQQCAREIMSVNFFGVEEAMRHFHVKLRQFDLAGFGEIPGTEEELEAAKDSHILVAVFPLSIL